MRKQHHGPAASCIPPSLGIESATQACAPNRNRTGELLGSTTEPQEQGRIYFLNKQKLDNYKTTPFNETPNQLFWDYNSKELIKNIITAIKYIIVVLHSYNILFYKQERY